MYIVHDEEYYYEMIKKLKNTHNNLDNLSDKIATIMEMIYSMSLEGASSILEETIDDLEESLSEKYLDDLADLINSIKVNNDTFLDIDSEMHSDIMGGK